MEALVGRRGWIVWRFLKPSVFSAVISLLVYQMRWTQCVFATLSPFQQQNVAMCSLGHVQQNTI